MKTQRTALKIVFGFLMVGLLIQPKLSYAEWGHHGSHHHGSHHSYRYHDHPGYGIHLSLLPHGSLNFSLRGERYHYYDGIYYNRRGTDYVIINPPVGAVVRTIPSAFRGVIVNGVTYYTDNEVYYVYTRNGYQVVPAPVTVVQPAPVYVVQSAPGAVTNTVATPIEVVPATGISEDSFAINIPNDKGGGYTAVVIKRSKQGFVGPQGEYYSEFPKVSQLKAMYAK